MRIDTFMSCTRLPTETTMQTENAGELEPLLVGIAEAARLTGESAWQVKDKLRQGRYKAKKSGRRTLIWFWSIKDDVQDLPDAKFAPPRAR
jgi:hypothetical protein